MWETLPKSRPQERCSCPTRSYITIGWSQPCHLIVAFITVIALSNKGKGQRGWAGRNRSERGRGEGRDKESFLCDSFAFIRYFTLRRYNFASHIKGTLHQYRLTERARMKDKEREIDRENRGEKSRVRLAISIDRSSAFYIQNTSVYSLYVSYRHMYIFIYIYIYNWQREDRMSFSRKFGKNRERLFKGSLGQKDLQFLHLHFLIRVSSLISSWHALQ